MIAPTTIDIHDANVPESVATVGVIVVVGGVLQMREETSLASTTKGVNSGIFEASLVGQTALVAAIRTLVRTLVTHTKSQHQIANLRNHHLYPETFIRSGDTTRASCSFPDHTLDTKPSIILGCENDEDSGQNLPTI